MSSTHRLVLITGASRGLGAFLAKFFWDAGWDLILVARNLTALSALKAELGKKDNQSVELFSCNFAEAGNITLFCEAVLRRFNKLDVLINNAATHGKIGPFKNVDLADYEDTLRVNLLAPVALCHSFIPLMEQSGGSIINILGGGATGPRKNFSAYAASKAALARFSESLAKELENSNVTINCVSPGAMKTDLLKELLEVGAHIAGDEEYKLAEKIFNDVGAPMEKVANLILFLVSPQAVKISGKLISANWDNWSKWLEDLPSINNSDVFTLRRIIGRDRGMDWADL